MAVGFSDGTVYKDETEWLANVDRRSDKQRSDQSEMNANETSGDFQSRFGGAEQRPLVYIQPTTDSTMPPQASTEAAGALKPTGGGGSTGESDRTRFSIVNPIRGMLNGPNFEDDKKILTGIWDSLKLPGNVSQGKVPMWAQDENGDIRTDTQAIEKTFDLAGLAVTGPAPVAAKMADGTLGSFMGVKSSTIDKTRLYKAQQMEMDMAHADDIWKETGTFRGPDKRWRQEIPDKDAKLNPEAFNIKEIPATSGGKSQWDVGGTEATVSWTPKSRQLDVDKMSKMNLREISDYISAKNKDISLEQVLDHPELFKAYPELRGIRVKELPAELAARGVKGQMSGRDLFLAPDLHPDYIRSVTLHEIQHAIQDIEGFAKGGSPRNFRSKDLDAAESNFNKVKETTEAELAIDMGGKSGVQMFKNAIRQDNAGVISKEAKALVNSLKESHPEVYKKLSNIVKSEDLLHQATMEHFEKYQRLMGEVEARNVQARMNYDQFDRKSMSPLNSQDRPSFVQTEQGTGKAEAVIQPYSPRWPNNDNARPRNAFERHIEAYDEMVRWRESLPKNKWGMTKWNDLTEQMHKNKLKALDKILDE